MVERNDLASRMRTLADADRLPVDHELRVMARNLEETANGFYAHPQTHSVQQMLGTWAKARKVWCSYTGEALL
jgi:hypothetical protein